MKSRNQLLLLTLAFALICAGAQAGGRSSPSYESTVSFGSQLLHLSRGCLSVDGTVASGNFFTGLERNANGGQIEYKKQGQFVTEYPDSLATSIHIAGNACSAAAPIWPSIFSGNSFAVRFEVEWKDGMKLRPATLSGEPAQCAGYSSVPIPRENYTIPSLTCRITVDSKGVPLSNHLIVSVFAADGQRLTRISAAP
jgi:hypothetical protein